MEKRWGLRILLLVAAATAVFYAGLFAGRPLLSALVLRMPENYEYLAQRYLEKRQYGRALQAVGREIQRSPYNFHARFLAAEIHRQAGRNDQALGTLWAAAAAYYAIVGRKNVDSRGWNEPRLHIRSARVLWDMERYEEALDELQAALDGSDPTVDQDCKAFVARINEKPEAKTAAWAWIATIILDPDYLIDRVPAHPFYKNAPLNLYGRLGQIALFRRNLGAARRFFTDEIASQPYELPALLDHLHFNEKFRPPIAWRNPLPLPEAKDRVTTVAKGIVAFEPGPVDKAYLTNGKSVIFYGNSVATGTVETSGAARGICIVASGSVCDDIYPILSVRVNGRTVGKRYIRSRSVPINTPDKSDSLAYTLPVKLAAGTYRFDLVFDNDNRNEITGLDRNAEVRAVYLY
jgi:tetratricopeptide (TPR) repeat protein